VTSTKTTEGLAADIAECARVEDAARTRFDAAVAELVASKSALSAARLATGEAIDRWRSGCKNDRPTVASGAVAPRGRPNSTTAWVLQALEREAARVFMAEELVVAIKNMGHDVDLASLRSTLGRLVNKGEIQRTGRGLYRANAGSQ
jgi:hypothetical protein